MPASQKRKPFLLRLDTRVLEALRRWSDDELRSLNGQIEYLLRTALREADRLPDASDPPDDGSPKP
jgi:hypothetical protein